MMKKSNLIILFTFALSTFSFAQDFSKWQIGLTNTVGRSTTSRIFMEYRSEKDLNFQTGLSCIYQMKYLFFEIGINYERREHYYIGYSRFYLYQYGDYDMVTNWLNVPLQVGVRCPTKFGKPYIAIGGYYNNLLQSKLETIEYQTGNTILTYENIFAKNQLGIQLRIGYQYQISDNWLIDLSYLLSKDTDNLLNNPNNRQATDYTAHHIALRLKYNL